MPAAIVGLAASISGAAVASAFTSAVLGAVVGAVVAMGVGYGGTALFGVGGTFADRANRAVLLTRSATDGPIPVIYGTRRLAPLLLFLQSGNRVTHGHVSGNPITHWNDYLYVVGALCEGELAAAPVESEVYLDGVPLTDDRWQHYWFNDETGENELIYRLTTTTGADDQLADVDLVAELEDWTDDHRARGCALVILRLKYDAEVFPDGLPNITVDVGGRKVYDTRDSTWKESSNPALIIRDYLLNQRFGLGLAWNVSEDKIDDDSFEAAANYCDESVTIGGAAPARYTCDGILNVDADPADNLRALLTCCRGMLVFSAGQYKLIIDKAETAESFTFDETNIVGGWSISLGGRRTMRNRIRAAFYNPNREWSVDYAIADSETFRALDGGVLLTEDIELPFTAHAERAKMLAVLALKATRAPIRVQLNATVEGGRVEVGDVVKVTHATPGWTEKLFRVMEIVHRAGHEVRVTLWEYDEDAYDFGTIDAVDLQPDTDLYDPTAISAPGAPAISEEVYETRAGRGVAAKAILTWQASGAGYISVYQVDYKLNAASLWTVAGRTPDTTLEILDIAPGLYDFRVKAISTLGISSDWSATTTRDVKALSDPPAALTNFTVTPIGDQALLQWDQVAELDVLIGGRIRIRHDIATSGAVWTDGVDVVSVPGRATQAIVPLKTGTYMAKPVDAVNIEATSEASAVTTAPTPWNLTLQDTVQEDTAFSGTKSQCEVDSSQLKISVDGSGDVYSSATYTFSDSYSGSAITVHRCETVIDAELSSEQDLIDDRTANLDDWPDFDGADIAATGANVEVYCRWKDASGDSYGDWQRIAGGVGNFSGRYAEFKAELTSNDPAVNILISQLRVKVYTYGNWS